MVLLFAIMAISIVSLLTSSIIKCCGVKGSMWFYFWKSFILFSYLASLMILREQKYVELGECAVVTYYIPMGISDYIILALTGVLALVISLFAVKPSAQLNKRKAITTELTLYGVIIITALIGAEPFIESRTVDWPYSAPQKVSEYKSDITHVDQLSDRPCYMDVNFDGVEEYVVPQMSYNRTSYRCYDIQDAEPKQLLGEPYDYFTTGFDNSTLFNYKTKTIRIGLSYGVSARETREYKWFDNSRSIKLIYVEQHELSTTQDSITGVNTGVIDHIKIQELINNELKTVKDSIEEI